MSVCLSLPASAQSPAIHLACEAPAVTSTAQLNGEAALHIPNHGTVHALVVFVQQADDVFRHCIDTHVPTTAAGHDLSNHYDTYCAGAPPNGRYQSHTEDPATEWPAYRMVNGVPTQVRPDWAERVIDAPGTPTNAYRAGSLSHFFWEMSRGTYRFEGRVYPDLVTVQSPIPQGMVSVSLEVLDALAAAPHGLDFREFDRYDNSTGQYTPDADGDGHPDGDGVFDMLILMPRTGGAIAGIGSNEPDAGCPPGGCNPTATAGFNYDRIDSFWLSRQRRVYLDSVRVVGAFPYGSGVYSSGFTFHRQVAVGAHEVGHHLFGDGHPCDDDTSPTATGDLTSIMCGPRLRRMSAPDRMRLGWLSPQIVTAPATTTPITLDPSPFAGDAIRITQAGVPAAGDVLVEARSFSDVWDGPSAVADGDTDDLPFLVREGVVVHQIGAPVTSPGAAHDRYSSMDNTGVRARRDMGFHTIFDALAAGVEPPHVGYAPGDAFTPLSRFRFDFQHGPLDSKVALTDISVAPGAVSFTLWGDFLTASANRTVRTNYTLANHGMPLDPLAAPPDDRNRARTDDLTFGGTLRLGGTTLPVRAGSPTITLLPGAVLSVPEGAEAFLRGPVGYTFPVTAGANARIEVAGRLEATRVAFSAASPASGWGGMRFGPEFGSNAMPLPSLLDGVSVSGVRYTPGVVGPQYPPRAAVEVRKRTVTLGGGTTVSGSVYANGVLATGKTASVIVSGETTSIADNEGLGILATAGAQVLVTDRSTVLENVLDGIRASGYGTRATVTGYAAVDRNLGTGLQAEGQAHARVRSPAGVENTSVSSNDGGPTARSGGSIDGGQCEPTGATGRANTFLDNYASGTNAYDASALGGSSVVARYAFWGTGRSTLLLNQDGSSTLSVYPLATAPNTPDPNCLIIESGRAGAADGQATASRAVEGGATSASRGGTPSAAVVALATEAREAAWAGDAAGAFARLADATEAAETDADREAVFEATAALLAETQPAATVAALEAAAAGDGDDRPWARRALAVAHASAGRTAEADALAEALAVDEAGTGADGTSPHALFGHGLRVRLAVEADSAAMALDRLVAFAAVVTEADTASVEAFGSALALVAAAFPDADLSGVAGARGAGGETAGAFAEESFAAGESQEIVDGLAVWPNPSTGEGTVRVSVSVAARSAVASVYDALGRRVAVLHDGPLAPGTHAFALATAGLAPGVYVVQVRVTPDGAAAWTEVRRVTVAR